MKLALRSVRGRRTPLSVRCIWHGRGRTVACLVGEWWTVQRGRWDGPGRSWDGSRTVSQPVTVPGPVRDRRGRSRDDDDDDDASVVKGSSLAVFSTSRTAPPHRTFRTGPLLTSSRTQVPSKVSTVFRGSRGLRRRRKRQVFARRREQRRLLAYSLHASSPCASLPLCASPFALPTLRATRT